MTRFGLYSLALTGITATSLALGFCRSDSQTIIKKYTDKQGNEVTLLDHDGDLSTTEERVTRGNFSAYGLEPGEGYTEQREFEPAVEREGRKVNKEVSFHTADGKKLRAIYVLEPREGALETPQTETENGCDKIRKYLTSIDLSKLRSIPLFSDPKCENPHFLRFASENEYGEIIIDRILTVDQILVVGVDIPTESATEKDTPYYSFDMSLHNGNLRFDSYCSDKSLNYKWLLHSGTISGDDLVVNAIGDSGDQFASVVSTIGNSGDQLTIGDRTMALFHEFDDIEVGTIIPGLGKVAMEIFEAVKEK